MAGPAAAGPSNCPQQPECAHALPVAGRMGYSSCQIHCRQLLCFLPHGKLQQRLHWPSACHGLSLTLGKPLQTPEVIASLALT